MTNVKERNEKLVNAGVDTTKFFDVNVSNIPMGSKVQIMIDGNDVLHTNDEIDGGKVDIAKDDIAKNIVDNGYVNNSKLFRRWIMAQTIKMMYSPVYHYGRGFSNNATYGWDEYFRTHYSYDYQFSMLKVELKTLNTLQRKDEAAFNERSKFFNQEIAYVTCCDYMNRLKRYINKLTRYGRKPNQYIKTRIRSNYTRKYYLDNIASDIYAPLEKELDAMRKCVLCDDTYTKFNKIYDRFYSKMVALPFETPKCPEWKDSYKGAGGYYSLKNGIMFHEFEMYSNYGTTINDRLTGLSCELDRLYRDKELWKFNRILKDYIDSTGFNFAESVAKHKNNEVVR